ncbi:MAG: nucleotide exchange factor GrpE [Candidatus Aureabacteria bacterium]|nr:nucleotide exchange factor GrpE [Candidatus Auribacterota bacterium]NLW94305.1 nucleotide exchange factor GrpE [Chlamydiota bacterium]HOE26621.1 nucleotide exchange factor GrpE [bacterium]HQM52148.1 nucleotide exchange factor GrpE [bacterium]
MTKDQAKGTEKKHETHDKKQVKTHLDIAMEKAQAMTQGAPAASPEKERAAAHELAALREKAAKADEYHDRMLRIAADLENYKKRAERDRLDLLKYGQEELMAELLGVIDNLERALAAAQTPADAKGLIDGVALIRRQFLSALGKFGLQPIEALGKPFNPEFHEAVAQVETDGHPEGTVVDETLRGYTLNGRLLRPSVVGVAAPPKGTGEETV